MSTNDDLPDIIDFATGSASSAVSVAMGNAIAGPLGGIAGGIAAAGVQVMLKKFVSNYTGPNLSISEKQRLRKVLSHFNTKMIQNLSVGSGKTLRQDCFFSNKINERSAAEEIFEGVLIAAQREHEEKKVKFEGNFFANIVYYPSVDKTKANFLLRLARELSYTQLCIVALLVQKDRLHLRDTSYRNIERLYDFNLLGLLQEIYNLYSQGLLFVDEIALAGPVDVVPAKMVAQGPIKELYVLMGLDEIEQTDINRIAEQLSLDRQVDQESSS
jgi:hypothetical protein